MSMELIAIIGVGVTLAGLILNGQRYQREEIKTLREETLAGFKALREEINNLREEINNLREEINNLRERMAHLEGLLEGLREAITGRRVAEDPGEYGTN